MLTVSLLVCAVMVLTRAALKSHMVKRSPSCPYAWTYSSGYCFVYIQIARTWADAERRCQDYGGNLPSVNNRDEYNNIQNVVHSATSNDTEAWLGGTDAQQEGTWFWIDGKPFKYDNWDRGQPDNNNGTGHCLVMNYKDNLKFDDQPCYLRKTFVCAGKPCYLFG
ncbi:ladderlectin-like [Sebastes fasciatus]|uniref:ladderlectin-like n=1 Tax=Sebastes fasciatus TaxID=394691 RepID=UPI003D9F1A80